MADSGKTIRTHDLGLDRGFLTDGPKQVEATRLRLSHRLKGILGLEDFPSIQGNRL